MTNRELEQDDSWEMIVQDIADVFSYSTEL